ncbi:MAG: hypothetical protein COB10_12730 [Planctomycetota bacterium]|jgi:hypothetical protein|nr:MAG: hypothetical protein COB10_12730 [Planctomycetota bacterium]
MAKKHAWVIHATHPTTYQTHIIRREGGGEWIVQDVLVEMGYLGVMMSAADYYDGPNFQDPWANLRAKGEVKVWTATG